MSIDYVDFDEYRRQRGELNEEEFEAVRRYLPGQREIITKISFRKFLLSTNLAHLVDDNDYEVASNIVGALGDRVPILEEDPRIINFHWVLAESYLMQGKDPDLIYAFRFPNL